LIGEDGEAQFCILDLALASREKNELHLVACFGWKKQGDELRRERETGITTGSLAMCWGTRGRGCGLRVCVHGVGSMVKKKRTSAHSRAQLRALARRLLGRQQQQARQWLGRCKKREHVREALGSYTKCRAGCVYAEGRPSTPSSRRDRKGDSSTLRELDRG
jgi:hypothetical protein